MKKRDPLQDAIDQHEASRLDSYEEAYEEATTDAHHYKDAGDVEKFYAALLRRKELRAKIAHAKICKMRTKEVR